MCQMKDGRPQVRAERVPLNMVARDPVVHRTGALKPSWSFLIVAVLSPNAPAMSETTTAKAGALPLITKDRLSLSLIHI